MADEQDAEPVFRDALFRQKRKHGKYRVVGAPQLEAPVVDTHAHLQQLPDPALALARCAVHGVSFVCAIVDAYEDGATTFDHLEEWKQEAADILEAWSLAGEEEALPEFAEFEGGSGSKSVVVEDGARLWACKTADGAKSDSSEVEVASGRPKPARPASLCAYVVPHVRIAVGCHPHNAKHYDDALEASLRRRLADPRVCAVGEIGLDYHYDLSPREDQRWAFRQQVRLAKECGLPVALHVREAHDEAFALLQEEGFPPAGALLHCFNLDWATLEPWLEAGCHVAFGGALTFKKSDETRDAAARVPEDRLLTETDSPYMAPEPLRGMTCNPDYIVFTAARLAEVRGCMSGPQREAFLQRLLTNARELLDRAPTPWQAARGKEQE